MRKKWNYEHSGVFALGYIQNSNSYLSEISKLAQITVTPKDLDENIKNAYTVDLLRTFIWLVRFLVKLVIGSRFPIRKLLQVKFDLMRNYNFTVAVLTPYPDVVEFFHCLDDIIYDSEVEIDLSFDRLTHIIEDGAKRNRFTEKYTVLYEKGDLPAITSTLIAAIENARKIAKRNYKYVVPQYRSGRRGEPGKIQFLMPIYLDRQYGERPDFALVLNIEVMPDGTRYYTPETILELPWAYNNARVICKPEDTWLNPATIDSPPFGVDGISDGVVED